MQLMHLKIENFRGIRSLSWSVPNGVVCLVGPGDSRKTTILEAMEYALSPRWNIPLTDADFHNADTRQAILIEATVGDLPNETRRDCGLSLRGWDIKKGDFVPDDEPEDGSETVITVRLRVDASLEPEWRVVTENNPNGVIMPASQRERLGIARVGGQVDYDLTWARGSALFRKTNDSGEAIRTLRDAGRAAADIFAGKSLPILSSAAMTAGEKAKELGVSKASYKPGLDPQFIMGRTGAVCLHDEKIPLRMDGLASRRLVALALQMECVNDGAILLIDEVEYGLEPYRIRNLLRLLGNYTEKNEVGQVILTTHSAVAVHEMSSRNICVVRPDDTGVTTVKPVPPDLRHTIAECPEALLAKKVIVCEGKTEYWLLPEIDRHWSEQHDAKPLAHEGVGIVDGIGEDAAAKRAMQFSKLGYTVAFFGDSDKKPTPSAQQMSEAGVEVVMWDGDAATEERIATDLPDDLLGQFVAEGITLRGDIPGVELEDAEKAIIQSIWAALAMGGSPPLSFDVNEWIRATQLDDKSIRAAVGRAAKKNGWFKTREGGEALGRLIVKALPSEEGAGLAHTLKRLEEWAYGC